MSKIIDLQKENLAGQARTIENFAHNIAKFNEAVEKVKTIKIGDLFISHIRYYDGTLLQQTNSRDLPRKFKAIGYTPSGLPVVREINAYGKPISWAEFHIPLELDQATLDTLGLEDMPIFSADPDQLNAILLDEEDKFDPFAQHKEVHKLFREVNNYNKSIKVDMRKQEIARKFFETLKPGDKFWQSPNKFYIFDKFCRVGQSSPYKGGIHYVYCRDSNQNALRFSLHSWRFKRVYSAQPRSFKKESTL